MHVESATARGTYSHDIQAHASLSAALHICSQISVTEFKDHVQIAAEADENILESERSRVSTCSASSPKAGLTTQC